MMVDFSAQAFWESIQYFFDKKSGIISLEQTAARDIPSRRWWFSGRIPRCHRGHSASIPGSRIIVKSNTHTVRVRLSKLREPHAELTFAQIARAIGFCHQASRQWLSCLERLQCKAGLCNIKPSGTPYLVQFP